MKINIITAFTQKNRVIGKDGSLIWNIPEDLKRFKALTMGHFCVVGYNTFIGLPPLPNRKLIVLSKNHVIEKEGLFIARTKEEAIDIVKNYGATEFFCIGGQKTYECFLPIANTLYITEVLEEYEGDAFFPVFNKNEYNLIEEIRLEKIVFKTYQKKIN
ncbi:MAG: dihydrofolate reductase [Treponema sp.]